MIDTTFNFLSDAGGGDPDSKSPTLRSYHQLLWSKPLANGTVLDLRKEEGGPYLSHESGSGTMTFGSDAITHSYRNHKRKKWITDRIPEQVNELFDLGCTIGAYLIFPNSRVDGKHTINQARGVNSLIDDRFDLTLECIRRYYLGEKSPLFDTLFRYEEFFRLFNGFSDYVHFFLLEDLLDDNQGILFHLPFEGFNTPPGFSGVEEYLMYKENTMRFIRQRNKRIEAYSKNTWGG